MGYRQYFPGPDWEFNPTLATLKEVPLNFNKVVRPVLLQRRQFSGFDNVLADEIDDFFQDWYQKNIGAEMWLNFSHNYAAIRDSDPDVFAADGGNPAYSSENGTGDNLCTYEPGVEVIATNYAKDKFDDGGLSVSLSPNDLNTKEDWTGCAVYDQQLHDMEWLQVASRGALHLANEVSRRLKDPIYNGQYNDKLYGLYAYNDTSNGPTNDDAYVDPQVVIYASKVFIKGDMTFDEVYHSWKKINPAGDMGVWDAMCYYLDSRDMPAANDSAKLSEVIQDVYEFKHKYGFKYSTNENCGAFGSLGLSYYQRARSMRDLGALANPVASDAALEQATAGAAKATLDEFLTNMFGSAEEPMRDFYHMLGVDGTKLISTPYLIGRLYGALGEAMAATVDPIEENRIRDLALYVRYAELQYNFRKDVANRAIDTDPTVSLEKRTDLMDDLLEFSYRTRRTQMTAFKLIASYLKQIDTNVDDENTPQDEADEVYHNLQVRHDPCGFASAYSLVGSSPYCHPYQDVGYSNEEVQGFITHGMALAPDLPFDPFDPPTRRAPLNTPLLPAFGQFPMNDVPKGGYSQYLDSYNEFVFYARENRLTFDLTVKKSPDPDIEGEREVEVNIYRNDDQGQEVRAFSSGPISTLDGLEHKIAVTLLEVGLYTMKVEKNSYSKSGTVLTWPNDLPIGKYVDERFSNTGYHSDYDAAFFVPTGTAVLGGVLSGNAPAVIDPDGQVVADIHPGLFSYVVPESQQGKLWRFQNCTQCRLYTVPPLVFFNEGQALLPSAVIDAEKAAHPDWIPWEPAVYSGKLESVYTYENGVVSPRLPLNDVPLGGIKNNAQIGYMQWDQKLEVFVRDDQLSFTMGLQAPSGKNGYTNLELNCYEIEKDAEGRDVLAFGSGSVDTTPGTIQNVNVTLTHPGQYVMKLENNDVHGTWLTWPSDLAIGKYVDDRITGMSWYLNYNAAFYVPKGTSRIGGFLSSRGMAAARLLYPDGTDTGTPVGNFSVEVPDGLDGQLWRFDQCGECRLYTVPPIVFFDERQAILPTEKIESDAPSAP